MNANLFEEESSYKETINNYIFSLGVLKSEIKSFRYKIHDLMSLFGIITFESLIDSRKKPYQNSTYGKFVNFQTINGKRKHIDSFILNETGKNTVMDLLKKYVTDNHLKNDNLSGIDEARKNIYKEVGENVLKHWLRSNNVRFADSNDRLNFKIGKITYTYYKNSNIVFHKEKEEKHSDMPFFFIKKQYDVFLSKEESAQLTQEILQAHYELKFSGSTNIWMKIDTPQTRAKTAYELELEARIQKLEKLIGVGVNIDAESDSKTSYLDPDKIKSEIRKMTEPLPKRPYLYDVEGYGEADSIYINEQMEKAYKYLKNRNLIDAVNAPIWKYNFNENSIDILARIDKRASAVFDVRHRLFEPVTLADGSIMKEKAEKDEDEKRFKIPFGLEKIDYRFKFIFVCEGFFDSCFIKNGIAITTCIMPHDMRKVIDVYRQNGFVIVHVPDNFRAGDKGGKAALREYVKKGSDVFHEEDLVFNWELWSDIKDINDVAVKYNWKKIDTSMILGHCWDKDSIWQADQFID